MQMALFFSRTYSIGKAGTVGPDRKTGEEDNRQLYLASVRAPDAEMPNGSRNMLYAVLAASEQLAVRAIQGERGQECRIDLQTRHDMPTVERIERLGLRDGRPRLLT
jgi:hypothetical protein